MYIFVRQDLGHPQQVVQACHAVAEVVFRERDCPSVRRWHERHRTMVVCGVPDERRLVHAFHRLVNEDKVRAYAFHDTFSSEFSEMTAFACHPDTPSPVFKRFKLLGERHG